MMPLLMMTLFEIKHLICDWWLQTPYHHLNKGKYGHLGGLEHVGIAMLGSLLVFCILTPRDPSLIPLSLIAAEGLIHYHCDWGKEQICRIMGWHANNSEWYWKFLGTDQFVHHATYLGMTYLYYCGG